MDENSTVSESPQSAQPAPTEDSSREVAPSQQNSNLGVSGKNELSSGEKILSAIGYFSFFCILPIVLKPKSEFCQIHGKQGMIITIVFLSFVWLEWVSSVFEIVLGFIHFTLSVLGAFNAFFGKQWNFPYLTDMAKKLDFSAN